MENVQCAHKTITHYILQLQKQFAVQSPISIDGNIKLDALHHVTNKSMGEH